MIYKLHPKNCNEAKGWILADSKDSAVRYFSALLHLKKQDLLKIFIVEQKQAI